jgi:hypothetical protein
MGGGGGGCGVRGLRGSGVGGELRWRIGGLRGGGGVRGGTRGGCGAGRRGGGGDGFASGSASTCQSRSNHFVYPPIVPLPDNRIVIIPCSDG